MKVTEKNKEINIQLTHEETMELQKKGWLYDHDKEILILFDKEEKQYSLIKQISSVTPKGSWSISLKL